ncbi:MAG: sugar ABC transporter permease, partial [Chloroflexi bacterium]|nr:sugar ABC transporter permease [Chloroflexota bacterium]
MTATAAQRRDGLGIYGAIARVIKRSPGAVREGLWGLFFVSPWVLGLLIFTIGPILASLYWGFTEKDILSEPQWIGLDNYVSAFGLNNILPFWPHVRADRLFYRAVSTTAIFAGVTVPIGTASSLLLAILLNQKLRGTYLYRTLFFMPHLIPSIAAVILWKFLMHPRIGLFNAALKMVGIQGPGWLTDPKTALMSIVLIGLWGSIGG